MPAGFALCCHKGIIHYQEMSLHKPTKWSPRAESSPGQVGKEQFSYTNQLRFIAVDLKKDKIYSPLGISELRDSQVVSMGFSLS